MRIKIHPADKWFSKCIREAADWTCEKCGGVYERGSQGLHCSHLFSRRHYSVRFCANPPNAFAHCFGCHSYLGGNPVIFRNWAINEIGEGAIELLTEKHNNINLAKDIKKNLKDVAAHYKKEHERLMQLRADGAVGKLEVIGYI